MDVDAPANGPSDTNTPSAATSAIPKGYGKIIRDADGKVLRVEFAEAEEEDDHAPAAEEEQTGEEMRDPEMDARVRSHWVTELGGGAKGGAEVVKCKSILPLNLCCCFFSLFSLSSTLSASRPFRRFCQD